MAQYQSREHAALAAADTDYELVNLGDDTAVSKQALSGKIAQIIVSFASDGAALGAGVCWLKISGTGVAQGEQNIMVGASGGELVTSGIQTVAPMVLDVDIPTKVGQDVKLEAQLNVDLGDCAIGVTLVYA